MKRHQSRREKSAIVRSVSGPGGEEELLDAELAVCVPGNPLALLFSLFSPSSSRSFAKQRHGAPPGFGYGRTASRRRSRFDFNSRATRTDRRRGASARFESPSQAGWGGLRGRKQSLFLAGENSLISCDSSLGFPVGNGE